WSKKRTGVLVADQPSEFYADLVFTDCGLLVVKHARLPKRNETGNAAWAHHFGLIGLLVYAVAESRRMSRERSKAEEQYFREAEDWEGAKPVALFRRVTQSDFVPADEISDVSFRKRGVLRFKFRDQWCAATADREM